MGKIFIFNDMNLEGTDLAVKGELISPWSHPNQGDMFPARAHYIYKNKFFIKVDVDPYFNIPQGQREWMVWNSLSTEDRKHFVKILDSGTLKSGQHWVAQPLLEQREMLHRKNQPRAIIDLCHKYNITDVWLDFNWCYYRDVPIIYDYGV